MTVSDLDRRQGSPLGNPAPRDEAISAIRSPRARPTIIMVVLVASVVPWRNGEIFAGGLDPVVIAKAVLGLLALLLALTTRRADRREDGSDLRRIGPVSLVLLGLYLATEIVGSIPAGTEIASIAVTVRVMLIAGTILLLVRRVDPQTLITATLTAMGLAGLVSAVTGFHNLGSVGRLYGGMPPLSPNEIALLTGLPLIELMRRIIVSRITVLRLVGVVIVGGCFAATGSRGGYAAAAVAILVAVLVTRRVRPSVAVAVLVGLPIAAVVVGTTDFVANLVHRGGDAQSIVTLNSRTIAWNSVLQTDPRTWERWIGSGISVKQVPVTGQYWSTQVLDSSWISSLAEAGVIGVVILGIWAVFTLVGTAKASTRLTEYAFLFPAAVFVMIRSVVESGLVDSTSAFIVFFILAALAESAPYPRGVTS